MRMHFDDAGQDHKLKNKSGHLELKRAQGKEVSSQSLQKESSLWIC